MSKQKRPRPGRAQKKARKAERRGDQTRIRYLMRNFRLSLTFRIALQYSWQLVRTALPALLILTVIFFGTVLADIEGDMRRIAQGEAGEDGVFSQLVIQDESIHATLLPEAFSGGTLPMMRYRLTGLNFQGVLPVLTAQAQHESMAILLDGTYFGEFKTVTVGRGSEDWVELPMDIDAARALHIVKFANDNYRFFNGGRRDDRKVLFNER